MSKANRKHEYDRLVSLDRLKDIPQDLMNEFNPTPIVTPTVKKKQVK